MTRDLQHCQVAARNVALMYNGWSLFVRCAEPERPRERMKIVLRRHRQRSGVEKWGEIALQSLDRRFFNSRF